MATAAIRIEKGVPLTEPQRSVGKTSKYPFKDMAVGDSFIALLADSRSTNLLNYRNCLYNCAKNAIGPHKIAVRSLPDGAGFRIWRIA